MCMPANIRALSGRISSPKDVFLQTELIYFFPRLNDLVFHNPDEAVCLNYGLKDEQDFYILYCLFLSISFLFLLCLYFFGFFLPIQRKLLPLRPRRLCCIF